MWIAIIVALIVAGLVAGFWFANMKPGTSTQQISSGTGPGKDATTGVLGGNSGS